ncbi:MAG: hypothetical protein K0Q51_1424 [Rickettsiaceae bacterium]|nr:hypothetical protein [Rickettsiaceae bacterium]
MKVIYLQNSISSLELQRLKNKIEKEKITKNIKVKDVLKQLRPQVSDNIKEILLLDKNLNVISTLYQDKYKGINLKHRQYLQQLSQNIDNIYIDEPVIGALTHSWAIPLTGAIVDINNNFDGALVFSLHLKSFSEFLKKKKYTPVLEKIHFLKSPLKEKNYINVDKFFGYPIKNFIKLILSNKDYKLRFLNYSNTLEQKLYITYDINNLMEKFYNQIKIYFISILLCSIIICLIIKLLKNKIVSPIKRIIERIKNTLQLYENNSETLIRNENIKADKINRLIKTFDSLLMSFQDK